MSPACAIQIRLKLNISNYPRQAIASSCQERKLENTQPPASYYWLYLRAEVSGLTESVWRATCSRYESDVMSVMSVMPGFNPASMPGSPGPSLCKSGPIFMPSLSLGWWIIIPLPGSVSRRYRKERANQTLVFVHYWMETAAPSSADENYSLVWSLSALRSPLCISLVCPHPAPHNARARYSSRPFTPAGSPLSYLSEKLDINNASWPPHSHSRDYSALIWAEKQRREKLI